MEHICIGSVDLPDCQRCDVSALDLGVPLSHGKAVGVRQGIEVFPELAMRVRNNIDAPLLT